MIFVHLLQPLTPSSHFGLTQNVRLACCPNIRNRRRRQNNGTPSNVSAGDDATGNVTNAENDVVVDVAANNAPEEDLNVAVVAERVADADLEGGHAFAGPVVNADRLVDRALVALDPADAPGPAEDPDSDSDDDSIDAEACRCVKQGACESKGQRCGCLR